MLLIIIVAITSAAISLARILVKNPSALSDLVWAEDGLFPLCIQGSGYMSCLTDPFAGYLLFLSRTLAYPVSLFPLSDWPAVTNIVSAIAIGMGSAFITWLLIRANASKTAAIIAGIIPVLIPIAGFEAVNASGSAYMIMLIIGAILVSFTFAPRLPVWITPLVLLMSALTIPSSAVLAAPIIYFMITQRATRRRQLINLSFLGAGLVAQLVVIMTAENPRPVAITYESFTQWAAQIPVALTTLIPFNAQLARSGVIESKFVSANQSVGFIVLIAALIIVLLLIKKGSPRQVGSGWLIFVGILMGLIPASAGYSNNRYFVIPLVALLISAVVICDSLINSHRKLILSAIAVVLTLLWLPGFAASEFRTTARPLWGEMLSSVELACQSDPSGDARVTFSPDWPFSDAVFLGPTSNVITCTQLERSK